MRGYVFHDSPESHMELRPDQTRPLQNINHTQHVHQRQYSEIPRNDLWDRSQPDNTHESNFGSSGIIPGILTHMPLRPQGQPTSPSQSFWEDDTLCPTCYDPLCQGECQQGWTPGHVRISLSHGQTTQSIEMEENVMWQWMNGDAPNCPETKKADDIRDEFSRLNQIDMPGMLTMSDAEELNI